MTHLVACSSSSPFQSMASARCSLPFRISLATSSSPWRAARCKAVEPSAVRASIWWRLWMFRGHHIEHHRGLQSWLEVHYSNISWKILQNMWRKLMTIWKRWDAFFVEDEGVSRFILHKKNVMLQLKGLAGFSCTTFFQEEIVGFRAWSDWIWELPERPQHMTQQKLSGL